jgi:hypothetical protein
VQGPQGQPSFVPPAPPAPPAPPESPHGDNPWVQRPNSYGAQNPYAPQDPYGSQPGTPGTPYGGQPGQPAAPYGQQNPYTPPQNPYAPQGPYGQRPPGPSRGLAITALILGLLALVTAWIPFWSYIAVLIGVAAVVLGIIGMRRKQGGMALTGVITGGLGAIFAIIMSIVWTALFVFAANHPDFGDSDSDSSDLGGSAESSSHTVELQVTGTATAADIDYAAGGSDDEADAAPVPWSKTVSVTARDFTIYNLDAMSTDVDDPGSLTCTIKIDGKVVKTETAEGPDAFVDCVYSPAADD